MHKAFEHVYGKSINMSKKAQSNGKEQSNILMVRIEKNILKQYIMWNNNLGFRNKLFT